jgi:hypothetical protein
MSHFTKTVPYSRQLGNARGLRHGNLRPALDKCALIVLLEQRRRPHDSCELAAAEWQPSSNPI